jgi:hypothetical protein
VIDGDIQIPSSNAAHARASSRPLAAA